jgi:hypothetical protein
LCGGVFDVRKVHKKIVGCGVVADRFDNFIPGAVGYRGVGENKARKPCDIQAKTAGEKRKDFYAV